MTSVRRSTAGILRRTPASFVPVRHSVSGLEPSVVERLQAGGGLSSLPTGWSGE
jgi:hypothetical protein